MSVLLTSAFCMLAACVTTPVTLPPEFPSTGEVWLAAGQSNMEWPLAKATNGVEEAGRLARAAVWHWDFRRDVWRKLTPENSGEASALAVSFATRRSAETGRAIALVQIAAGGAPTEAFLSPETMAKYPWLKRIAANPNTLDKNDDFPCLWCKASYPTRRTNMNEGAWWAVGAMYRSGVARVKDLPFTGILWYQGESNATTCMKPDTALPTDYHLETLRAIVSELRGERNLPMLIFGLPYIANRPWAPYRASQRQVAAETGALFVDAFAAGLGEPNDVHPRDKVPFACLALEVLNRSWAAPGTPSVTLAPDRTEVLIAPGSCETVRFAADEMTNFLARVLGAAIPLVTTPTPGRTALVLGENSWSKAAGLDLANEPSETFFVKAERDRVFIVGKDDATFRLRAYLARGGSYGALKAHARGTVHGVYAFLEKQAGVRFYWPDDELGVVVPSASRLVVPEGLAKTAPEFSIRAPYFHADGTWYMAKDPAIDGVRIKAKEWLRLRLSSEEIACCHGIRKFKLRERFEKTHPEFFPVKGTNCHLCWTNPELREIIYQDVKKRFLAGEKVVDLMPDDGFRPCPCARCQAAYEKKMGPLDYANTLIWGFVAEVGRRLQAEGVSGTLTMMSYSPYSRVPALDLPSNVRVMVAVYGPWSLARPDYTQTQYDLIRAWQAKTGGKVWLWTYPYKLGRLAMAGVPQMAPHAWADYYRGVKDAIFGAFAESESDNPLYNYLNYYVFSRTMWDSSTDVDALIAEHDRILYGNAAPEMHDFNALLEETWTKRVAGACFMDELGPVPSPPCALELWTSIYNRAYLDRLEALLTRAASKVVPNGLAARRIALMRREFLEPLVRAERDFFRAIDPANEKAYRAAHPENVNLLDGLEITEELPEDKVYSVVSTGQIVRATASMLTTGARRLKPNTRYRISFFLKLDDVVPTSSDGGVTFVLWDAHNNWFPRREQGGSLSGTTGWFAQHYEITTAPDTNVAGDSYFRLQMRNATGRMSFNALRIDELPER